MARPREFDIDEALNRAMEAFWRRGYEATSMTDLVDAMGVQKGSIYKAFKDKHSLFMAALQRYMDTIYDAARQVLTRADSPVEGIGSWLVQTRRLGRDGKMRKGCLGINSMAELAPHDREVSKLMQRHFDRMESLLVGVITEGQEQGQLRRDVPARRLAHFLSVFAAGTAVTTKGSLEGLDRDDTTDVVLSALTGA